MKATLNVYDIMFLLSAFASFLFYAAIPVLVAMEVDSRDFTIPFAVTILLSLGLCKLAEKKGASCKN
jgi:hypothetical protein